jgi:hypothetical protein
MRIWAITIAAWLASSVQAAELSRLRCEGAGDVLGVGRVLAVGTQGGGHAGRKSFPQTCRSPSAK